MCVEGGGLGRAEDVSRPGGLAGTAAWEPRQSATSVKGEAEHSWEAFCSLSCPAVNRTTMEQSAKGDGDVPSTVVAVTTLMSLS